MLRFPARQQLVSTMREFAHHVRYLNNFSRKWLTLEALVSTVPLWRLLGEELRGGGG